LIQLSWFLKRHYWDDFLPNFAYYLVPYDEIICRTTNNVKSDH